MDIVELLVGYAGIATALAGFIGVVVAPIKLARPQSTEKST